MVSYVVLCTFDCLISLNVYLVSIASLLHYSSYRHFLLTFTVTKLESSTDELLSNLTMMSSKIHKSFKDVEELKSDGIFLRTLLLKYQNNSIWSFFLL